MRWWQNIRQKRMIIDSRALSDRDREQSLCYLYRFGRTYQSSCHQHANYCEKAYPPLSMHPHNKVKHYYEQHDRTDRCLNGFYYAEH